PLKYVGSFVAGAILLFVAVWSIPGVLKSYQKDRIEGLLHANAKDNGYQSLRSQIAFGSGGLLGEGYLQGEQKKARFI
ncbi:FtsW/RodA/SpoVE family cell cycle protein, partial [Acinetobacter baumannii]